MKITIEIDTREDLSTEDKAILRAVGYMDAAESPAPAAPAAAKAAPAKKAAAPAKKAAAAPADPEPTPDAPPAESGADDGTEALRDAVAARASELLSSGERDRIIAALKAEGGGAGRVGEVTDENLQAFLDAITD